LKLIVIGPKTDGCLYNYCLEPRRQRSRNASRTRAENSWSGQAIGHMRNGESSLAQAIEDFLDHTTTEARPLDGGRPPT
jgi:hypothetical protein